ncbi:MAG: ATP-binding protein [Myxococcota bacterium]
MADGTLHFLIGPVGAGKTTFARRQIANAGGLFLDADTWMVRLYGADPRPEQGRLEWYLERRNRVRMLMWDLAGQSLDQGVDVFLELGLVTAAERASFFHRARGEDRPMIVHHLDASRDERRKRVARRNEAGAPFTQVVAPEFFELASDAWEDVLPDERSTWGIIDESS